MRLLIPQVVLTVWFGLLAVWVVVSIRSTRRAWREDAMKVRPCATCGYDMGEFERCPECGWPQGDGPIREARHLATHPFDPSPVSSGDAADEA